MKKYNKQFRNKNYDTDILSFEGDEEFSFGDLLISVDQAKKQSVENKHSLRDEYAYLILHGVLHLLGYEHEDDPKKAKKMFSLQDKIYEKFLNQTF